MTWLRACSNSCFRVGIVALVCFVGVFSFGVILFFFIFVFIALNEKKTRCRRCIYYTIHIWCAQSQNSIRKAAKNQVNVLWCRVWKISLKRFIIFFSLDRDLYENPHLKCRTRHYQNIKLCKQHVCLPSTDMFQSSIDLLQFYAKIEKKIVQN